MQTDVFTSLSSVRRRLPQAKSTGLLCHWAWGSAGPIVGAQRHELKLGSVDAVVQDWTTGRAYSTIFITFILCEYGCVCMFVYVSTCHGANI